MPKRTDIHSILIIGSGPIVIGQACEFDYSGTQACRVLREEGYRVILANSNPATIMTDPDFADATYIEPLTWEVVSAIIDRERPDAVLPTLGGQTGLNIATGKDEITSQNHNFAVDPDTLSGKATMTHVNLNDGVCEGLRVDGELAFSVQHHPESNPGPHDSHYLFEEFADMMKHMPAPGRAGASN